MKIIISRGRYSGKNEHFVQHIQGNSIKTARVVLPGINIQ
jgi:hypothetical protein